MNIGKDINISRETGISDDSSIWKSHSQRNPPGFSVHESNAKSYGPYYQGVLHPASGLFQNFITPQDFIVNYPGPEYTSNMNSPALSESFDLNSQLSLRNFSTECTSTPQAINQQDPSRMFALGYRNRLNSNLGSRPNKNVLECMLSDNKDEILLAVKGLYKNLRQYGKKIKVNEPARLINTLMLCATNHLYHPSISRFCFGSILYLSFNDNYNKIIYDSGFIKFFDNIDRFGSEATLVCFMFVVSKIFTHIPESKEIVLKNNSLIKLIGLLNCKNQQLLIIGLHILALCSRQINAQHLVTNTPLLDILKYILKQYTDEEILYNGCRLLRDISINSEVKKAVVLSGIVQQLTVLLINKSVRIAFLSLYTIRNLSNMICHDSNQAELISILTRFISSQVPSHGEITPKAEGRWVSCCLSILANLSCNDPKNKILISSNGFVSVLLKMCLFHEQSKDILEATVCILRHITCRNPASTSAIREFFQHNGVTTMCEILNFYSSYPLLDVLNLKKVIFGLLFNLCSGNEYLIIFRENKVTYLGAFTLAAVMNEMCKEHYNTKTTNTPSDLHNLNKLLELCVGVLFMASYDDACLKLMISSPGLVTLFIKLFLASNGSTLVQVINFLNRISDHEEGLCLVEKTIEVVNDKASNIHPDRDIFLKRIHDLHIQSHNIPSLTHAINLFVINLCKTQIKQKILQIIPNPCENLGSDYSCETNNFMPNWDQCLDSPPQNISNNSSIADRF